MPKLFFRKKKKEQVQEKPHIKSRLAPKPAFTAVPHTPPPQSTVPGDHAALQNRPTSAPTSQSEWPQDGYSLLEQPDHLSNDEGSDGSDPQYSTVKKEPRVHGNHKRPTGDMPPSDRPRMATPPSVDVTPPVQSPPPPQHSSPSPMKREPSASPLQERVLGASVTNGLSVHSDTGDNLLLNAPPPPLNRESQQPRSQHMTEEEKAQLYSTVVKSKKGSKSAELPPKSPHSIARGSESPSTRRDKMKYGLAKDLDSKTPPMRYKTLSLEGGSPRQRTTSKRPSEKKSRGELPHGPYDPSKRVERVTEASYAGENKFRGEEFYANVIEYSDEDYLPSDEASESCSEAGAHLAAHALLTEDIVDSPVVTRRRHYSAGHSTNRPPVSSSGKRSRSSSWGRHRNAYPAGVLPPLAPLSQPTYLQPLSHDNQHIYLFSRRQPDGSLQYYTATALQTPSSPVLPSQPAPLGSDYFPNLPVLNWPSPSRVYAEPSPSGILTQIPHPGQIGSGVSQNVPPLQSYTVQQQQHLVQEQQQSSGGKASDMSLQPQPLSIPLSSSEHATTSSSEPKPSLSSAPQPSLSTPARKLELQLEKLSSPGKSSHAPAAHNHQSASSSLPPPTKASTTKRGSPQNTKQHGLDLGSPRGGLRDSGKEMDQRQTVDSSGRRLATGDVGPLDQMAAYQEALTAVEQRETSLKVRVTALEGVNATLQEENTALKQLSDKMRDEKDRLWKVYQDEVCQLKEEIAQLSEENRGLLSQIQEGVVEREQWGEVAAHARLVLEENSVLLKQQELQRKQRMEMKREHETRVSQLSGEVAQLRKERESLGKDLRHLGESHSYLQEHVQLLSSRSSQQLTVEEYQQALQEIESLLEELAERTETDSRTHEAQMKVTQKEKNGLVTKLTDAKAIILQLEGECAALHKSNRKVQERVAELQYELEASRDREVAIHEQLSRAVVQAKKALAERDTFARIAKSQRSAQDRTNEHRVRSEHTISKLKKKVETYKDQASLNHDTASLLLHECEQHMRSQRRHYEEETQHLRSLLEEKQQDMDRLTRGKKNVENQLDLVWKPSTTCRRPKPHTQ